jgi:hypothetical protein
LSREKEEAMLKRLSEPTMFPSVVEQAVGFVGAAWKHIFAGMPSVTDEQYETRLAVCNNCPSCDKTDENWKCRECGCSLKEGVLMPGKARWASEDCPKGLWPKIELPVVKTGGCGGCGS